MSLLTLVQNFCQRTLLNVPSTVLGSTDPQIQQIKALLEEEGIDLAQRGEWQELVNEGTLTISDAPNSLTGAFSTVVSKTCIDTGTTFLTDVTVGALIQNTDTLEETTVASVVNDTQIITTDAIFTAAPYNYAIVNENLGDIDTILSNGFRYIKNETSWDRTEQLPLYDVEAPAWQQIKANNITGPYYEVRIRGGDLLAQPIPSPQNVWAFEYISYNWLTDSTGTTYKEYFTQDTDLMLLPERILMSGLRWRWKKEKGLEYAEDFFTYEKMVHSALSRQGFNGVIRQDQKRARSPGIVVPQGSWNL